MVFGNFYDTTRININLGDYLQFITINHVYNYMGISDADIHYIDLADVMDYEGEPMILPFNYSIHDFIRDGEISISPHITPVFIALQLDTVDQPVDLDKFLSNPKNQAYLLQYSPIGCRDITTYQYLSRYGIPAYINGCMTATLPKYAGSKGDKIILVDAPNALRPYIPDSVLRQNCEAATQQVHFTQQEVNDFRGIYSFVKSRYDYYRKNAKLIITSRLHVALPCTAFGIPVIFAKDHIDTRLDFLEKYFPVYSQERYAEIDWEPNTVDYEPLKQKLIAFAASRIQNAADCLQRGNEFTSVFLGENKPVQQYGNPHRAFHKNEHRFERWAKEHWKTEKKRYALWGVNEDNAAYWVKFIQSKYPGAELAGIFDRYKQGSVLGTTLKNPNDIENLPEDVVVIVCAVGATSEARQMFKRLNWGTGRYCITADCFIMQDDL